MYLCLSYGIAIHENSIMWFLFGLVATIGSSGFPRFAAGFVYLSFLDEHYHSLTKEFNAKITKFNSIYWEENTDFGQMIVIPRNREQLFIVIKQIFSFPGNIFLFTACLLGDAILFNNYCLTKYYLIVFSIILFFYTIFSTIKYMKTLKEIPLNNG